MGASNPAIRPVRVRTLSCGCFLLLLLSILPVRSHGGEATLHTGSCGFHVEQ